MLEFSRILYLCNHLSESIHSWTKGTLHYPTPPRPTPTPPTQPYINLPVSLLLYPTPPHPTPTPTLPHPTLPYPTPPLPSYPTPTLPTPPLHNPTPTLPSKKIFKHMHITKPVAVELRCHATALIKVKA